MQSLVPLIRAMVEIYRVQQSEAEPWQSYAYSSRVKQSYGKSYVVSSSVKVNHGRDMQCEVEQSRVMVDLRRIQQREVEPWQSYVESSRMKYSHGVELCRVQQSEVEP